MKHRIAWVGRKAACPFLAAASDYEKRLRRLCAIDVVMVRPSTAGQEATGLAKAAAGCDIVVALDERGQSHTTRRLADLFANEFPAQASIGYLIGGADGLLSHTREQAQYVWSLSAMTLPHRGVLAIWLEQLYRVHSILAGTRYHRE